MAQSEDDNTIDVSILTIGPGANLYDKFGHSAFRVHDRSTQIDYVFNYGTYDFNTPNFYTKFARGKLLYSLSVETYDNFYARYVQQNRWVKEQVLNLTPDQEIAMFEYLKNNSLPENRKYKYDFFYDNCATKIRDVLVDVMDENIQYKDSLPFEAKTFRELIQQNVHYNSWGSLGMDVGIGAVTDVTATAWEHQFLPDYVYEAAKIATVTKEGQESALVKTENFLFENSPEEEQHPFLGSPLFVFGIIGLVILLITYRDYRNQTRSRFLDSLIFLITGFVGVVLLLLWLATDHTATANNYNMLWAFPFSVIFTFAIGRKSPKRWLRKYIVFLLLLMALIALHSMTGVQGFAIGFIPLFIALTVRYLYVIRFLKRQVIDP